MIDDCGRAQISVKPELFAALDPSVGPVPGALQSYASPDQEKADFTVRCNVALAS